MKKKNNKEKLDRIIYSIIRVVSKVSMVLFCISLISIFLLPIITYFFPDFSEIIGVLTIIVPLSIGLGVGTIILLLQIFYPFDKNFNLDKNFPVKYLYDDYKDYKSLLKYLNQRLKAYNYAKEEEFKIDNNELIIYLNKKNPILLDFIVVFRTEEYVKSIEDIIDNKINEFYREYNSLSKMRTKCITLLIVDKKNSLFDKYCENGYIWEKYNDLLHVGISLKEKKIYISNINEFLLRKRCEKIQNQVLDIFELLEKDKI